MHKVVSTNNKQQLLHAGETVESYLQTVPDVYDNCQNPLSSFPAPNKDGSFSWPEKDLGATTVRYIFWRHNGESGSRLKEAIKDSDVLAIELVRSVVEPDEDIEKMKAYYNGLSIAINGLLGATTPQEEPSYREILSGKDKPSEAEKESWLCLINPVYSLALRSLLGSAVRLQFLDVGPEHSPQINEFDTAYNHAKSKLFNQIGSGEVDFDTLVGSATEMFTLDGSRNTFRENVATKQIEELAGRYTGANITVVYGSRHLVLPRMVNRPEVRMQRIFLDSGNDPDHDRYKTAIGNINSLVDAIKVTGQMPTSILRQAVMDRMAERLLTKGKLPRYCQLSPEQKAEKLEKIMALWQDKIPKEDPKLDKKSQRRVKKTIKILKS